MPVPDPPPPNPKHFSPPPAIPRTNSNGRNARPKAPVSASRSSPSRASCWPGRRQPSWRPVESEREKGKRKGAPPLCSRPCRHCRPAHRSRSPEPVLRTALPLIPRLLPLSALRPRMAHRDGRCARRRKRVRGYVCFLPEGPAQAVRGQVFDYYVRLSGTRCLSLGLLCFSGAKCGVWGSTCMRASRPPRRRDALPWRACCC